MPDTPAVIDVQEVTQLSKIVACNSDYFSNLDQDELKQNNYTLFIVNNGATNGETPIVDFYYGPNKLSQMIITETLPYPGIDQKIYVKLTKDINTEVIEGYKLTFSGSWSAGDSIGILGNYRRLSKDYSNDAVAEDINSWLNYLYSDRIESEIDATENNTIILTEKTSGALSNLENRVNATSSTGSITIETITESEESVVKPEGLYLYLSSIGGYINLTNLSETGNISSEAQDLIANKVYDLVSSNYIRPTWKTLV